MGLAALPKNTWSSPAFLQQQLDTSGDLHHIGHLYLGTRIRLLVVLAESTVPF